jgi:hypothetical protein
MIRSGFRATTSSAVTTRSLAAPWFPRSAKMSMPPAISTSSETHPMPAINGSSHSSKNTLGRFGNRGARLRVVPVRHRHCQPDHPLRRLADLSVCAQERPLGGGGFKSISGPLFCRASHSIEPPAVISRDRKFADSPREGDGFEPSVPRQVFLAARRSPRKFTSRNINRLARDRDRWFESISLQQ